ncbi:multiple sugar transport system permease [Eubacterium sp. 14-2]|uniref:carbohydrate ABC transporter permease n=1 Tax=Eubacterium sp. 14-2 TaxID=1235790 RepID=UPI00033A566A|nr:carbohydrate ABC transporter permease [Eubacterium sp. 14-2]EOT24276.1 multiple sugar transport system permease [Eubacterium sp. 14-2]
MDTAVQSAATEKKRKVKTSTIVIYTILILWALLTIFPFVWVALNSFKPSAEVLRSSFSLPAPPTMMNYENAFGKLNVLQAYGHSFAISGTVTIGVMILASLMSFALTRYDFKGKQFVRSLIVASLMFPVFATIIPVFKMMVQWGLLSKNIAVILPQIAGNLSFATIVMTGFMQSIPLEMEEAAYMEGANVFQVFTRIIVPLCRPSLATVAIFSFLWSYNDLFVQKIMIRDSTKYPISSLLEEISSQYGTDFGLMAASVTIIVIPVMIVYILLQKNIIKGLTAGAVKG